jgi:E3 ubiquitin-protein ligase CCNP1IP1
MWIVDMQLSQEQLQKKNQELVEIYREKSKKHAQITNLYNLLKSRAMRSQIQTAASDSASQTIESLEASKAGLTPDAGLHPPLSSLIASPTSRQHGPYPVTNDSNEQLHRNQRGRAGIGSPNNNLDNIAMAPPSRPPGPLRGGEYQLILGPKSPI